MEAGPLRGGENEIEADGSTVICKEIYLRWWVRPKLEDVLQILFSLSSIVIEHMTFSWTYASERLNSPASLAVRCDRSHSRWGRIQRISVLIRPCPHQTVSATLVEGTFWKTQHSPPPHLRFQDDQTVKQRQELSYFILCWWEMK